MSQSSSFERYAGAVITNLQPPRQRFDPDTRAFFEILSFRTVAGDLFQNYNWLEGWVL